MARIRTIKEMMASRQSPEATRETTAQAEREARIRARIREAAPEMYALLRRLAYEPVGGPEASDREVLNALTDDARALLAKIDAKEN